MKISGQTACVIALQTNARKTFNWTSLCLPLAGMKSGDVYPRYLRQRVLEALTDTPERQLFTHQIDRNLPQLGFIPMNN